MKSQAVPLAQQEPIVKKIVSRLRDKSSNVRRYVLHLLGAFLNANPFAAKVSQSIDWVFKILILSFFQLPLEELTSQYEAEMIKMEEMKPGSNLDEAEGENYEDSILENSWMEKVPEVLKILHKVFKEEDSDSEEFEDALEDMDVGSDPFEDLNQGVSLVGEALEKGKTEKAINTLRAVMEKFPEAEVFE